MKCENDTSCTHSMNNLSTFLDFLFIVEVDVSSFSVLVISDAVVVVETG